MRFPGPVVAGGDHSFRMREAGNDRHGLRVRALIAVLRRAGLRIIEALALALAETLSTSVAGRCCPPWEGDKRRKAGLGRARGPRPRPPTRPRGPRALMRSGSRPTETVGPLNSGERTFRSRIAYTLGEPVHR
ncbi:MAG: hypothetical protein ACR2OB_11145 [Solirubrobacteraceae bacterium]